MFRGGWGYGDGRRGGGSRVRMLVILRVGGEGRGGEGGRCVDPYPGIASRTAAVVSSRLPGVGRRMLSSGAARTLCPPPGPLLAALSL